jgi:hypothetical protein
VARNPLQRGPKSAGKGTLSFFSSLSLLPEADMFTARGALAYLVARFVAHTDADNGCLRGACSMRLEMRHAEVSEEGEGGKHPLPTPLSAHCGCLPS